MLVSYKWLQDYVDIDISPEELADRLTMAGLTCEGIEKPGAYIDKAFTGKILETAPHPNADRLTICQITLGEGEPLQIVTGASNIKVGDIVPVAVNGAKLANDVTIKNSKLRGVPSNGMLCSGGELGLDPATMTPEQAEGIMILAPDTPLGQDIKSVIGLDDAILDLELTPNRGDAMSMLGVAREVSAALGVPVKWPSTDLGKLTEDFAGRVQVEIAEPQLCFRYIGKLFTDIKVEPSPEWMQKRLQAAGVRPINNIVDITNYVLMEMGQPLHAFDYDKVKDGHIIVRRARDGEKMTTLDGVERQLDSEMLLIADPEKPLVVAGVMGGLESEVTENTKRVLLESAVFEPVCVRKTSKKLGLRSESSSRFERGVDITNTLNAANRAACLLLELGAGKPLKGEDDNYPQPFKAVEIKFRPQRAEYLLGMELKQEQCRQILDSLAFEIREEQEVLWVKVPAHRPDVRVEADLIEEIARMVGYNQIKATLPYGAGTPGQRTVAQQAERLCKDRLAALGFREVVTYSFISPDWLDKINLSPDDPARQMIALQNPLSEEHSVMRTVTLPCLLQILQRNSSRQINNLAVFELGKVYLPQSNQTQPLEKSMLTIAAMGKTRQGWNKAAVKYDFYYLKGILEVLLQALHIDKFQLQAVSDQPSWHPGRTARILIKKKPVGILGEIHPEVGENYQLPERAVAMVLDFAALLDLSGERVSYQAIPRYPAMERDLALVVEKSISADDIIQTIHQNGGSLLQKVWLFDVYTGRQIAEGCQSLAFSLTFSAEDRTLTDEEINQIMQKLQDKLASKYGAALRS